MKENKEVISLRIPESLNNLLYAISTDKGATITDVTINLIKIGLENSKQFDTEIIEQKNVFLKLRLHDFQDLKLKIIMKERFLVSNFKKLMVELTQKNLTKKDKDTIARAGLERIKTIFGESSEEYADVKKYSETYLKLEEKNVLSADN